ncbi:MAG TPA: hypothetical protein VFD00_07115 [Thermoclostridium sp.]|nr:hypothetical protein [Thermoclostridium sp.]
MLASEGKGVTIIEKSETILNVFGLSAANYNMMMELLDYYNVKVIKNAVVDSYEDGVANITETEKNYPNIANRAKRLYALGDYGHLNVPPLTSFLPPSDNKCTIQ